MSGTGIGEAVILLLYGTGKLAAYAIGGAAWLTYHGVKAGAQGIHELYQANEARRRENAIKELRAVENELARLSAEQLERMQELETKADQRFLQAAEEIEKSWKRSQELTDMAEIHVDAALDGLKKWFAQQETVLNTSFDEAAREYSKAAKEACMEISRQITAETEKRSQDATKALEGVEDTLAAREERYRAYAERALRETRELLDILQHNYDCETFASAELHKVQESLRRADEQLAQAHYEAASALASIAVQDVQVMQIYAEQRTAQFAREKMLVEQAAADLAEAVRASHDLKGGSDSEEIDKCLRQGDASFWSEGRLDRLWERAEAFREKANAFAYRGTASAMPLIREAQQIRMRIIREYDRTRQHIAGCIKVMDLACNLVEAHAENGWEMAEEAAFVGNDCRNDVRLVFQKGDDRRVVLIHSAYDEESGMYTQQIIRHAEEAGEPDEQVRQEEDELINQALSDKGVPEEMHVHCDRSTLGQKASV